MFLGYYISAPPGIRMGPIDYFAGLEPVFACAERASGAPNWIRRRRLFYRDFCFSGCIRRSVHSGR